LNARGVIVETTASFETTWQKVDGEIKWDQNAQKITIHDADVYPDLEYTEASARATYVKYASAARINELLGAINQKIEASILSDQPDSPKPADNMQPNNQVDDQTGVTENEEKKVLGNYTVVIAADRLRFTEGQRNTTTANAELLFRVSGNLQPELGRGGLSNQDKIAVQVSYNLNGKLLQKIMNLSEFEEDVTKFGGNLIVQALPSIEVKFKAKEDVYAYDDQESTEVKVTKAVRADLEKLPEEKLSEIENMILRIRQTRTAKKTQEMQASKSDSNK
jgi:hypothetical protein